MSEETINLWEAIRQMRILTSKKKSFSFVHVTLNRDEHTTNGFRNVKQAHLRPAAKGDDIKYADEKLFYFDEDIRQPRNCWQILILYFNGMKCTLR
ncbi:MAG: hypothetical protein ABSE72_07210 [Bacteroidales bacterium]|jgi:hypothetical protein